MTPLPRCPGAGGPPIPGSEAADLAYGRGECPACGRRMVLNRDAVLRFHRFIPADVQADHELGDDDEGREPFLARLTAVEAQRLGLTCVGCGKRLPPGRLYLCRGSNACADKAARKVRANLGRPTLVR